MMDNNFLLFSIFQLLATVVIFVLLVYMVKYVKNNIHSWSFFKNSKFAKPLEYFPSEHLFTLRQIYYWVMILIFILIILYLTFGWVESSTFIYSLDIIISVYLCASRSWDSLKDKIILLLLIPLASITGLVFRNEIFVLLDIFHIIGYVYFIHVYYRKFVNYTKSNGLGISILVTFSILLVSFLFTIIVEGVSPMDSMTMVSNAFTSNSFEASGNIMIGKVNSLVIAWGGFILSSVGTATLTVSIVMNHVSHQFDEVKDLIKNKKEKE